jgi:dTDP-glucose 4,6-dehydratase
MSRLPPASYFNGSIPVVLVVGGAGFLGSFLCERLLLRNLKVICLDNWQTGLHSNISGLLSDKHFFLLEGDANVSLPYELLRVNYVIYLAGLDSYVNGEDLSIETLTSGSVGVKNLLDFSLLHSARFVLGSMVGLYPTSSEGTTLSIYFGRDRVQEGLFSHHEAKRFAEVVAVEYGEKRSLDVRIVRFGNLYGPRMPLFTGGVVARIFKAYLHGEPLLTSPSLSESILYPTYVEDAVDALERVIFSSGIRNGIVTASGEKTRGEEVLQVFRGLRPAARLELVGGLLFPSEPKIEQEVSHLGRGLISWHPKINLKEGVEKTLEWFDRNGVPSLAILESRNVEVAAGREKNKKERVGAKLSLLNLPRMRLSKLDFGKNFGSFGLLVG